MNQGDTVETAWLRSPMFSLAGVATLLFSFAFFFFLHYSLDYPMNGDTYVYARSLQTFEGPLIHGGYYLLGRITMLLLSATGCSSLHGLAMMSAFFGGISTAGMYLFTYLWTGKQLLSVLSALILLFSGPLMRYSIHGEVYVPQLGLILLAMLAASRKKPFLASLLVIVAMSVTPTSVLCIPAILYILFITDNKPTSCIRFLFPLGILALGAVVMFSRQLLHTLQWAMYFPEYLFHGPSLWRFIKEIIGKLCFTYGKSLSILSFFAIPGLVLLAGKNMKLFIIQGLLIVPFILYLFNYGLFSPDHLILSFVAMAFGIAYFLFRCIQWLRLSPLSAALLASSVAIFLCVSNIILFIQPEQRDSAELQRVVFKLSTDFEDNAVLIAEYSFGTAFWSLTGKGDDPFPLFVGQPSTFMQLSDPQHIGRAPAQRFWINVGDKKSFVSGRIDLPALLGSRPVYFVDYLYWPTRAVSLLLTEEALERRLRKNGNVHKLTAYLEEISGQKVTAQQEIHSPRFPVYKLFLNSPSLR